MEEKILNIKTRAEFRKWLIENSKKAKECFLVCKRGKPTNPDVLYYLDCVEEVLCFGWIDSTQKSIDGQMVQRFSPRAPSSPWTELNKQRVRRLMKLGLMKEEGLKVLPPMGSRSFKTPDFLIEELKKERCYSTFKSFPPLYQRIRAYNLLFMYHKDRAAYEKSLTHFLECTKKGELYGEWDDYGRLSHE